MIGLQDPSALAFKNMLHKNMFVWDSGQIQVSQQMTYIITTLLLSRTASLDVEPVYTFRAHNGPVLCLAMSATGETCYSGGLDATIRCWNIPNSNIDPYDSFGEWELWIQISQE